MVENNICCLVDAYLKHGFSQIDANDFYRVRGVISLKK